jgi:hypothetical protein
MYQQAAGYSSHIILLFRLALSAFTSTVMTGQAVTHAMQAAAVAVCIVYTHAWTCYQCMTAFCACAPTLQEDHPDLCKVTEAQCRKSFCSPICTSMAWKVDISVDCNNAPQWVECSHFKVAMAQGAARAITTQFQVRKFSLVRIQARQLYYCCMQAHVCSSILGCCTAEAETLNFLVDQALFEDHYPQALLPVQTCSKAARNISSVDLCTQCQKAVSVQVSSDSSNCAPAAMSLSESYSIQPLSLHERVCQSTSVHLEHLCCLR